MDERRHRDNELIQHIFYNRKGMSKTFYENVIQIKGTVGMIITEKTTGHMKRNIKDIDKGRKEYLKSALKNKS